jgi:hypothetical protein
MFQTALKDVCKLVSRFGPSFLNDVLAKGPYQCRASEMPPEMQAALCDWRNTQIDRKKLQQTAPNQESPPTLDPFTPESLAVTDFSVSREYGTSRMPRFRFEVWTHRGQGGSGSGFEWPFESVNEDGVRSAMGMEMPKTVPSDPPLPDEPKITIEKLRLLGQDRGLLLGDVLEAMARQSGRDVLADYHFGYETMQAVKDMPLRQLVENSCGTFKYACQADGNTLRFRFREWYLEPLMAEPPADLIERFWMTIESKGGLEMGDLRQLAFLPDDQMKWPGFRRIPGVWLAGSRADTLRLWACLSDSDLSAARSEAGLPVSQLAEEQRSKLSQWTATFKVGATEDTMAQSVIHVSTVQYSYGNLGKGTGENVQIILPDGSRRGGTVDLPPPLKPEDRKAFIAQRKADAEADKVEVVR